MILRIGIFYVLTWFFLMLLGGIQQATGFIPAEISLAQWGPGIAALLMLLVFRKDGQRITFFSKGTPALRYLLAALIPAGLGLVVYLMRWLIPMEPAASPQAYNAFTLLLAWMPLGALGEELGWRGYLHQKLHGRMRGLISSVLVGVLWMPIHVHFFSQGPVFLFFLALLFIAYSVVIYALVQDRGFSVLLATLFHLSVNLSNLLFLDVIYETSFMMVNALVWTAAAVILVLWKKKTFLTSQPSPYP